MLGSKQRKDVRNEERCTFKLALRYWKKDKLWHLSIPQPNHNHNAYNIPSEYSQYKRLNESQLMLTEDMYRLGCKPKEIYDKIKSDDPHTFVTPQSVRNVLFNFRKFENNKRDDSYTAKVNPTATTHHPSSSYSFDPHIGTAHHQPLLLDTSDDNNSNSNNVNKGRRCGLCRHYGHDRRQCPSAAAITANTVFEAHNNNHHNHHVDFQSGNETTFPVDLSIFDQHLAMEPELRKDLLNDSERVKIEEQTRTLAAINNQVQDGQNFVDDRERLAILSTIISQNQLDDKSQQRFFESFREPDPSSIDNTLFMTSNTNEH